MAECAHLRAAASMGSNDYALVNVSCSLQDVRPVRVSSIAFVQRYSVLSACMVVASTPTICVRLELSRLRRALIPERSIFPCDSLERNK